MTTTTLPSVAERVAAGAALLDEHRPGWDRVGVSLDGLDMADCHDCVLGQMFGHYSHAFRRFNADWTIANGILVDGQAMPLGFAAYTEDDGTDAEVDAEYAELTAAWRTLIETRRAVVPDA